MTIDIKKDVNYPPPIEVGVFLHFMIKTGIILNDFADLETYFHKTNNTEFSDEEIKKAVNAAWKHYQKILLGENLEKHFLALYQFTNS